MLAPVFLKCIKLLVAFGNNSHCCIMAKSLFFSLLTRFFFRLPNTLNFACGMVNQQVCHNDGFLLNCCLISLVGSINQVEYQFFQHYRQAATLSLTAVSYYFLPQCRISIQAPARKPEGAVGSSLRPLACTDHTHQSEGLAWWRRRWASAGSISRGDRLQELWAWAYTHPLCEKSQYPQRLSTGRQPCILVMFLTWDVWCLLLAF